MIGRLCFILFFLMGFYSAMLFAEEKITYDQLSKTRNISRIYLEKYMDTTHRVDTMLGYDQKWIFAKPFYHMIAVQGVILGDNTGGFGTAAFGVGGQFPLWIGQGDIAILAGAGGGGAVKGGGGFLMKLLMGFQLEIMPNILPDISMGFLTFPSGSVQSLVVNVGCSFAYDRILLNL